MSDAFAFAQRTDWALGSNQISRLREDLRRRGIEVLDLTESNPTRCGLGYPQKALLSSLSHKVNLLYEPSPQGSPQAREAVRQYYRGRGFDVSIERIVLTSSTSEAYSYLFRLLANPGEEILFPKPGYPLFQFLADLNDVRPRYYSLVYDGHWHMDLKHLEESLHPLSKAIVVVNPNNPTGSFIQKKEWEALRAIGGSRNPVFICDEVFWDFTFEPGEHVSLVNSHGPLTFTLGGLSKALALPQMKLSWIVISGPEDLVEQSRRRLEVMADTYLSVNTPAQNALQRWLPLSDKIQKEVMKRIQGNLNFLKKNVQGTPCQLLNTEGGWYAVLRIPNTLGEEEWALKLLKEDHVFIHPGYFFDFEREAFLVASLLPREKVFQSGINRVLSRVQMETS
jgi:aspartate/methionine/tyrosine aminotransferase